MYRLTALDASDESAAIIERGRFVWWSVGGIVREIWIVVD